MRRGPRPPGHVGPLLDADIPAPGYYRTKQSKGGASSAVRIWLGPPIDPDTGEEMSERGSRWQASIDGGLVPLDRVWPGCSRDSISRDEYERILARNSTLDEESAFYDVRKPIDLNTAPPPF